MQSCSTTTTSAEDGGNSLMQSCSAITTTIKAEDGGRTLITAVHPDIIQTLILTKLDGPTLISATSASSQLHNLCSDDNLWRKICNSSWPSTSNPLIQTAISSFPSGHRSFFSDSFPSIVHLPVTGKHPNQHFQSPELISPVNIHFEGGSLYSKVLTTKIFNSFWPSTSDPLIQNAVSTHKTDTGKHPSQHFPSPELISAVDIHFEGGSLYSKVLTTETKSGWFMSSPFRIELLGHKETFPTPVKFAGDGRKMKLSWILIDQTKNRAVNISSLTPVSVRRHWLTEELKIQYSTVMNSGASEGLVTCGIVVTCEGKEGGELHVREVSMQIQDIDGKVLCGKDSLVILQEVIEGGRKKRRENEIKENYENFLELKKKWKEKKQKREKRLDMLCIISGITIFVAFWSLILLGLRSNGSYFS